LIIIWLRIYSVSEAIERGRPISHSGTTTLKKIYYYHKLQFICKAPSFLDWTDSFQHIQNGPNGFQKLFSLTFLVAFVGLSLRFCSQRSSFAFLKPFGPFWMCRKTFPG
jgi:hypothetical protein